MEGAGSCWHCTRQVPAVLSLEAAVLRESLAFTRHSRLKVGALAVARGQAAQARIPHGERQQQKLRKRHLTADALPDRVASQKL